MNKWYIVGLCRGTPKQQMISHYKQAWRRRKIAKNYIQWGCDEVWEINEYYYNQRVCELSPVEFLTWIRKHGKRIG